MRNYLLLVCFVIIAVLIYFFLGVGYGIDVFSKMVMTLGAMALFIFAYRRSFSTLSLVYLTWVSIFVALGVSFSGQSTDSWIALNLVLGAWSGFLIATLVSVGVLFAYKKGNYPLILFCVYVFVWIILAFNVKFYEDWKIENYLTVPFLILIYGTHKWFRFSNLSYALIYIFMTLHIFGSHYTYSDVPFGFWLADVFGIARNHYDRIVHFSFGLLLAYPVRELFRRVASVSGFWAFYIPVELVLAMSCIYEIIEWGVAIVFGGDLGVAYLGTQGDVWDAQKDMFLAGLGSLIAMIVTAFVILYYKRSGFLNELKNSFKVDRNILGEVALEKIRKSAKHL